MAEEKKVKTAAPVIDAQAMVNELVEKADKALEEI